MAFQFQAAKGYVYYVPCTIELEAGASSIGTGFLAGTTFPVACQAVQSRYL